METIPTLSIENAYGVELAASQKERFNELHKAFTERYGGEPEVYSRSPGRVNLIGEHIDYEGYGVLPMAIRQDTIFAVSRGGTGLHIGNVNAAKYPDHTFPSTDPDQPVDTSNHVWANYFLAAYKGVHEHLAHKGIARPPLTGLRVMVDGRVPTGSGLSSSAAFTCGTAIALLKLYNIPLTKSEVADFCARCERYVGAESGGMDQAISLMGKLGVAQYIEFKPVRSQDVVLPPGGTFVIANSLTVSNKAETGPLRYNLRVVECTVASIILALGMGVDRATALTFRTLEDVEKVATQRGEGGKLGDLVDAHLHAEPYGLGEVEGLMGVKLTKIFEGRPNPLKVISILESSGGELKLWARARHVYSEKQRVLDFKGVCMSEQQGSAHDRLVKLGQLMNDSHESCSKLYECSCDELEELVGVARQAGAIGARLTGAGWGGCTVSLVADEHVERFMQELRDKYFTKKVAQGVIRAEDVDKCLFASKPAAGGAAIEMARR